ncbi:hypothetical protein [Microbacterium sp. NPDC057658]|uniref:hypothetical protein n=1 Tax=unclassified Microbacterium TaxID=2609290 RepID=UPI00367242A7
MQKGRNLVRDSGPEMVGLFSSHSKQIQQGRKLLQEARIPAAQQQTVPEPTPPRSLPRITKERLIAIAADYEAGMSAYGLAEKYGHNRGTIMKHLAQAGVRSRVAVPTDAEVAELRQLHSQGLGYKTIARQVGRNHKTVRKYLSPGAEHEQSS